MTWGKPLTASASPLSAVSYPKNPWGQCLLAIAPRRSQDAFQAISQYLAVPDLESPKETSERYRDNKDIGCSADVVLFLELPGE